MQPTSCVDCLETRIRFIKLVVVIVSNHPLDARDEKFATIRRSVEMGEKNFAFMLMQDFSNSAKKYVF